MSHFHVTLREIGASTAGRKCIYACAHIALFAGLAASANAQGLTCDSLSSLPTTIGANGYAEMVGDILIRCHGVQDGVSTAVGSSVAQGNVHVSIPGTTITSRTTATGYMEPLLMIDEPGKSAGSAPQVYCGSGGNDSGEWHSYANDVHQGF